MSQQKPAMVGSPPRILVVDSETVVREHLREWLPAQGYQVILAEDGSIGKGLLNEQKFDLVLAALKMPRVSGIDLLRYVQAHQPNTPVILMTACGTIENALEGMKMGAYYYITKPFISGELDIILNRAFERQQLIIENRLLRNELLGYYGFESIIGSSKPMLEVFEIVRLMAAEHCIVLIKGEAGTGKELIARVIHYNSSRKGKPFIKISCDALPDGLIESELFGANSGTILFDEIQELSLELQAKLLHLLDDREFKWIEDHETIPVDVRIMAITSRDLEEEVKKGRFSKDLFYQLNVFSIQLPPLSKRREDIPLLASYFLKHYCRDYSKNIEGISDETMLYLHNNDWPGNVRELANYIERAVVKCRTNTLEISDLFIGGKRLSGNSNNFPPVPGATLREIEKWLILKTLSSQKGNRTRTADQLDISIRTLRNKIKEYRELDGEKISQA